MLFSRLIAIPLLLPLLFFSSNDSKSVDLIAFPKSIFEQDNFFPLAVWLQAPKNVERYQELGVNLYVGLWGGPTESQLTRLKKARMKVITGQNEVGLETIYDDVIVGWLMSDEPDNAQYITGTSKIGAPIPPAAVFKRYQDIQRLDPNRPVLLNLGQGVAWDQWYGRGVRTNHPEDYIDYVKAGDIVSFDIYPVTHKSPEVMGQLDFVPKGVDRLIRWTDGKKPVWSFVGASRISNPNVLPTGDDIRRQVWLSIIHGATGIVYFVHQFRPKFVEAGLLQHEELSAAVKEINARITSLASVLNNKSIVDALTVEASSKVSAVTALVKQDRCNLYIFAGSKSGLEVDATFHVKHTALDQNFNVLDENRSVRMENKSFQDKFGPYAVHLYQLKKDVPACP